MVAERVVASGLRGGLVVSSSVWKIILEEKLGRDSSLSKTRTYLFFLASSICICVFCCAVPCFCCISFSVIPALPLLQSGRVVLGLFLT